MFRISYFSCIHPHTRWFASSFAGYPGAVPLYTSHSFCARGCFNVAGLAVVASDGGMPNAYLEAVQPAVSVRIPGLVSGWASCTADGASTGSTSSTLDVGVVGSTVEPRLDGQRLDDAGKAAEILCELLVGGDQCFAGRY